MSVLPVPDLSLALPAPASGLSFARVGQALRAGNVAGLLQGLGRLWQIASHFQDHRRLLDVLKGVHVHAIFRQEPRLAYRYTLPYLSGNFDRGTRLDMLMAHYRFMNDRLGAPFCQGIVQGTLVPWRGEQQGHQFSIHVGGPCAATGHREGELTLTLRMDGADVYKVSFSIIRAESLSSAQAPAPQAHTLYIGRVQGTVGAFEQIRIATKACHDVAPPDLLMAAVAGMAGALGIDRIVGVGIEHSISSESIKRSDMSFDYTAFWERYMSCRTPEGHHLMHLPFPEKAIQSIAAKHRKRTLVKREFKRQIADAMQACIRGMASGL